MNKIASTITNDWKLDEIHAAYWIRTIKFGVFYIDLDVDDVEWFRLIWNVIVLIKQHLLEFNIWASWVSFLSKLAQLYG